MLHAYTGPEYSDDEIAAAVAAAGLEATRLSDDELFPAVAERIAAGDVVGWFQGRMEFGPRALGHRSIVADPRRAEMKDVLNARIKHREAFRPFAPSILAEATGDWFEQDYTSPFMVLVYKTRPEKRGRDPGRQPRRRHRPRPDRRARRRTALLPPDRGVRPPDRRPDRPQHVVQRGRADRDDARRGGRHVPAHAHGRARAREPRRHALSADAGAASRTCSCQSSSASSA